MGPVLETKLTNPLLTSNPNSSPGLGFLIYGMGMVCPPHRAVVRISKVIFIKPSISPPVLVQVAVLALSLVEGF